MTAPTRAQVTGPPLAPKAVCFGAMAQESGQPVQVFASELEWAVAMRLGPPRFNPRCLNRAQPAADGGFGNIFGNI